MERGTIEGRTERGMMKRTTTKDIWRTEREEWKEDGKEEGWKVEQKEE